MMQNFNVTERVTEIVLHVGAVSTATDNKQFLEVIEAVKAIPEFVSIDGREFRYNEFEIWIGQLAHAKEKIDALDALASFDLSAAPSFVSSIPIGSSHCAIVSRYAACPGERLARVETTTGPFREAASRRFRAEMQTLIDHGLVHPFVRGPYHWLVSSETGTLVLDSWYALRECDREEGVQMMEKVDRQLASRSEAAPTPSVRATENATTTTGKSRLQEVFGCPRVLLPVIHPIDQPTAMESVRVAHAAGVKGIFLINQGMSTEQVLELVMGVRARFPTLWIGLNLLGLRPAHVLEVILAACAGRVDGIWVDNAHIEEDSAVQPVAQELVTARRAHGWDGLYFGGVAFKYQRDIPAANLGRAAAASLPYMDVVCTSGPGTGQEAAVDKVIAMRTGLGAHGALALASGVTEANVGHYLPYVDASLVGTGIEHAFGILDADRVARLHRTIMAYRPENQARQ
jgi:uncharacterized protein